MGGAGGGGLTVRGALADHLAVGALAVVGVSGGADSVALLHLVREARPDLRLVVGHVRHMLRPDGPDVAAASANAALVGAGLRILQVRVGDGSGPEDAARRARLDALTGLARDLGAAAVLLGHTADDQAETVLLRIARGTGPDGLAGMAAAVPRDGVLLVRPLLALRRADVRRAAIGPTVEDPTNTDAHQRRARARRDGLAMLRSLHPDDGDPVPLLVRLADLARADAETLDALVAALPVVRLGDARWVPVPGWPADRAGIRARLLRRAWATLRPGRPAPPAATVDAILALSPGGRMHAPGGVAVTASAAGWVLDPADGAPPDPVRLDPGGTVTLPALGLRVRSTWEDAGAAAAPGPIPAGPLGLLTHPFVLRLPDTGGGTLVVCGRGRRGTRAARRILQSHVPAGLRHLVPLVTDVHGDLLAVGAAVLAPPRDGGRHLVVTAEAMDRDVVGYPPTT